MLKVGLTGNYGMGKSTVLEMFRKLGAITLTADGMVGDLLSDAAVLGRIREVLGEGVFFPDGRLDRAKVASLIFHDKGKRDDVEGILHPLVFEKIEEVVAELDRGGMKGKIVIVEIPLLFEKGYAGGFQRTVTVYADEETALRRLGEKGIGRDDARMRIDVQMPVQEKVRRSDFVIDNNGSERETEKQVREVFERLLRDI